MNFLKSHLIIFNLFLFISVCAQQMHFKTTCTNKECVINAFTQDALHAGYLKLSGCRITYLNVFPQFEKTGFAKALLEQARLQAAIHDCKEVSLYSLKSLLTYYQRNGFTCDQHKNCTHPI
jgi:GNAT superfamily N-acetyltransferase